MQIYVIRPTELKPGSMTKMDWALDALGRKRWHEHDTKVLIWQIILTLAVASYVSLSTLIETACGNCLRALTIYLSFNAAWCQLSSTDRNSLASPLLWTQSIVHLAMVWLHVPRALPDLPRSSAREAKCLCNSDIGDVMH
jgi:hypothetical protein